MHGGVSPFAAAGTDPALAMDAGTQRFTCTYTHTRALLQPQYIAILY